MVCIGAVLPIYGQAPDPKANPAQAQSPSQLTSLLNKARTCLGIPYRPGGVSTKGFDCSGFVRFVFGSCGIDLDRTSGSQAKQGDPIDLANIQPGDLLFFSTRGMRKGISHVGIYLGEGQFIHASSWRGPQRGCVKLGQLASSYFSERLVAARRIVSQMTPESKTP
ncbi:MAG: C40 family peptidase [Holophaga sp.]|nr:C40 family peptidase [Holophaga sp.]